MNNLVVQLLLKTGTFSTDLKTAKGQVQNFQKGCQDAGKSLNAFGSAMGVNVGTLTKLGGTIGAAALAGKELKAILDSSQTSADSFQGAIAGCKGVLDTFNTAIATADFTSFSNGLWSVFDAAKAVQDALDQLANTQIAYDYKSKENMTKFQEAYNVFKDPNSTAQMKEDAKRQMQEAIDAQFTYANNYSSTLYKTYVAQVVKKAGSFNLSANNVTRAQFERAMNIDLGLEGDPQKARQKINDKYKEYLGKIAQYETSLWDRARGEDKYNNLTAVEDIKKDYRDTIAIHAMLELMKDDELKGVAQLIGSMEDAKQQALSMQKTFNRATSSSDKPTGGRTTRTKQKEEKNYLKGSEAYWDNIKSVETENRRLAIEGSEAWEIADQKVKEAETELARIRKRYTEIREAEEGSKKELLDMLNAHKENLLYLEKGSAKYQESKEKVEAISKLLQYWDLDEALDVEPPTLESLGQIVSILTQLRKETDLTSEEFKELTDLINGYQEIIDKYNPSTATAPETDSWDKFNQAMANTSTIVSSLTNTFKENSEVTMASVLQMVATCLPAIGSLVSAIGALTTAEAVEAGVGAVGKAVSTSKHWIEAIAAVASLGAVVAAAIGSAQKVQKFANGGIVGGSSFTGDRITAGVNSGEMILNKSQQANLFRMANGGGTGNKVEFHISGTDLVGVLNNNNRKNRLIR